MSFAAKKAIKVCKYANKYISLHPKGNQKCNIMCLHPKRKRMSYSALSRLQAFADAVLADGKKRGRELVVGSISNDVVMDLQQKGVTLETTDVIIDDAVIVKYIKHVKNKKGATVDSYKYWLVEKTLRNPTHIYEDTEQKYLVYLNTRTYAKRKVIKVVIHPNFKNNGRTYNLLKSIGVVEATKMDSPQYRQIK